MTLDFTVASRLLRKCNQFRFYSIYNKLLKINVCRHISTAICTRCQEEMPQRFATQMINKAVWQAHSIGDTHSNERHLFLTISYRRGTWYVLTVRSLGVFNNLS